MGVLNYLKSVLPRSQASRYKLWLTDTQPIFSNFGEDIYLSDFVNNAIERVAMEVSKIELKSVVENRSEIRVQNDDITRLFRFKPNPLQTTSDFLANVEWIRRKKGNVFIYPQYEIVRLKDGREFKRYISFYPLNPQWIEIGVRNQTAWEVRFYFEDGSNYTLPYADLIHLKWRRGGNTVIGGGDEHGNLNNYEIKRTLDALDKTIQGLPKSIEASLQVKGVFSAKTMADQVKLNQIRDEFEKHIVTSSNGMIATDLAGEFTPAKISTADIPDNVMKFLKAVIQERYGVSAAILSGDYTGEQHSAFYQTAIEEFIVQFEQAATACIYTQREMDVGHRLKAYYSKVQYMDSKSKLELANLAKETGIMNLNQIGAMFGIEPFEGGNRRLQSLNYVNLEDVDSYQKGKAGVKEGENDNQEG